jgi:hypothetical protein
LVLCINWIGEIETNNNVIVIIENNNIEDKDKDNNYQSEIEQTVHSAWPEA